MAQNNFNIKFMPLQEINSIAGPGESSIQQLTKPQKASHTTARETIINKLNKMESRV